MTHSGKACTLTAPHDPATCRYVHFMAGVELKHPPSPPPPFFPSVPAGPSAPAAGRGSTIRIANDDVDVALLVPNSQVSYLLDHPHLSGTLCRLSNDPMHDPLMCKFVHYKRVATQNSARPDAAFTSPATASPHATTGAARSGAQATPPPYPVASPVADQYTHTSSRAKPQTLLVNGAPTPVESLVHNAGLQELLRRHPMGEGRWCRFEGNPRHDITNCTYIHRQPVAATPPPAADGVPWVRVDQKVVSVRELIHGAAVSYLLANPTKNGQWCRHGATCTNKMMCSFVHPIADVQDASAPEASRPAPTNGHNAFVLVDQQRVAVSELVPSKAVNYLLTNPGKSGQWCRFGNQCTDMAICSFAHRRSDLQNPSSTPPPYQRTGPPPGF
jgi:hypothetical protein